MRNSHWLRPIRPVRSCIIMDACRRESELTSDRNFFGGAELSIARRCMFRGDFSIGVPSASGVLRSNVALEMRH